MTPIKLALLNKLDRQIEATENILTALNVTDEILVIHAGDRIYLDHEVLDFARKYYSDKLAALKKEFEEG